eukprot:6197520-Pleurochrysis_carterae.AAC.2
MAVAVTMHERAAQHATLHVCTERRTNTSYTLCLLQCSLHEAPKMNRAGAVVVRTVCSTPSATQLATSEFAIKRFAEVKTNTPPPFWKHTKQSSNKRTSVQK